MAIDNASPNRPLEGRPRKRWILWTVAIIVGLLAVGGATVAAVLNSGPYGFLSRHQPKRVKDIDFKTLYGNLAATLPGMDELPSLRMLEFDFSKSKDVLASLKGELTPARGYVASKEPTRDGEGWSFKNQSGSGMNPIMMETGAYFVSGTEAVEARRMFDEGFPSMTATPKKTNEKTCIVLLVWKPTWMETQWLKVKRAIGR